MRSIVKALEQFKVQIRTVPNLHSLLQAKVDISQVRDLVLEDLLERPAVQLDLQPVRRLLNGKRIFVSGAAGSIGSELCRQVLKFDPEIVLACDRYENGLFNLQQELSPGCANRLLPVIADVTDARRIRNIMMRWHPHIVFHAAAYKHVPMMQENPCEATKNNVAGTRVLAEACREVAVQRFILISTDKAVNPTSVMGATKRVAEMLIRAMADETSSFVTVRFCNVLGSNGSVVPQFVRQIKQGGPITVTHSEMRRFFMLIGEAVQLVLHAATVEEARATYVLEMGEPVRILDMARNLARLAGYLPDIEMPIVITGLRPGEKLYEELTSADEIVTPSTIPGILRVESTVRLETKLFQATVTDLEQAAREEDEATVLAKIRQLVPAAQLDGQQTRSREIRSGTVFRSSGRRPQTRGDLGAVVRPGSPEQTHPPGA
jgi:FlaA1/EpsC-like NDP-sugar epimerase